MNTLNGYNEHDYQKLVAYFEGECVWGNLAGEHCDPIGACFNVSRSKHPTEWGPDPRLWGWDDKFAIEWVEVDGELRLKSLKLNGAEEVQRVLDLSGCTALKAVRCDYTELEGLNVSGCTALEDVYCVHNGPTWVCGPFKPTMWLINVSGCTALKRLDCSYNNLIELDVSGCTALEELSCTHNRLAELDVSGCTALKELYCSFNSLTSLNVSGLTLLKYLECHYNNLTELDVSSNTALQTLYCCYNKMKVIDVSRHSKLRSVVTDDNMSKINIRGCTSLEWDVKKELQRSVVTLEGLLQ